MRAKKRVVAMLLAGGQGSRLKDLTKYIAKPAVPFGGKYKIIDFALSNATNSDIRDIGVLTQYKPFSLNAHLGNGAPWDLDRNNGGLRILQPFFTEKGGKWYEGTANAIYENINYLENLSPEYVLILSADHIYKMDYNELLKFHKSKGSALTVAVREVPWEEASRFGILNADDDGRIVEFEEKPEEPKSNLASMGIYMFDWPVLKHYLEKDNKDDDSSHDFGKNIIPSIIGDDKPVYAYKFDGYWKDVGTVRSYWEANLDLLEDDEKLNLYDSNFRIFTKSRDLPPHYISSTGKVKKSLVNEACVISGKISNSVLFSKVTVEEGAVLENCVVLSNVKVNKDAKVYNSVITEDIVIEEGMEIGNPDENKVYLVSNDGIIEE